MNAYRTSAAIALGILCLAAGCDGCGRRRAPRSVREAKRLANLPAGDNKQALKQFVNEQGFDGLKRILDRADEEHMAARLVAIGGLGMLAHEPKATQLLLQLCDGEDPELAHWAIIALGSQGAPEAKDAIARLIKSPDPERRAGACLAIKEYGDESLHPLLDAALDDPDSQVKLAAQMAKRLILEGQVVGGNPDGGTE